MSASSSRLFRPGPHDGLCGFYAALNALRYLEYDMQPGALSDAEYFDEAVECLARVPGIDVRILKADPAVGGIDQYQIRDLCILLAERLGIDINVELKGASEKAPFAKRYRCLLGMHDRFALIVPYRDGSHWVAAWPGDRSTCLIVDAGKAKLMPLQPAALPRLANDTAVVLIAKTKS